MFHDEYFHASLCRSELYRLQEAALAEKKKLRKILREFESQFMFNHGRCGHQIQIHMHILINDSGFTIILYGANISAT